MLFVSLTLYFGVSFDSEGSLRLIREEGGKMYMEEQRWMDAYHEFFEGFRNYQVL
jgi:hypothetical protein